MKKFLQVLAIGAAALAQTHFAQAQVANYSDASRQITLKSVSVGNIMYPNVVLRLDSFAILQAEDATAIASAGLAAATYNDSRRVLTLPSVQVGTIMYPNVVLRLDNFTILAAGQQASIATPNLAVAVPATCTNAGINTANYRAIAYGMTMDQVRLLLNCQPTASMTTRLSGMSMYVWGTSVADIRVFFNQDGTVVQDQLQLGTGIKTSTGTLP